MDGLCAFNQIHNSVLQGVGDSAAPMAIMIFSLVVFRQIYLFIVSHVSNSLRLISFGFPAGWLIAVIILEIYFHRRGWKRMIAA